MEGKLKLGIDFEIPEEYAHEPYPEYIEKGYFVMADPKLFPDGIVRKRVMVTPKGAEFLKKELRKHV